MTSLLHSQMTAVVSSNVSINSTSFLIRKLRLPKASPFETRPYSFVFYVKQGQMFLLVSRHHAGAHPVRHQHGVSIQISINLSKQYLAYKRLHRPESWRGSLHIYLLSGTCYWTLSIEHFLFLF